jgi:hypothetical protein
LCFGRFLGGCFVRWFASLFDGLVVWVLWLVEEQFVVIVYARGNVSIPLLVREVLNIEDNDHVCVSIAEVIKKSEQVKAKK